MRRFSRGGLFNLNGIAPAGSDMAMWMGGVPDRGWLEKEVLLQQHGISADHSPSPPRRSISALRQRLPPVWSRCSGPRSPGSSPLTLWPSRS